jgi:hypothetical protein
MLLSGTDWLIWQHLNGLMPKAMTRNMILVVNSTHSQTSEHSRLLLEDESCQLSFSVTKQSGVRSKLPVPPLSDVLQLDTHNFDEIVLVRLMTCYISVNCSCFFFFHCISGFLEECYRDIHCKPV